MSQTKAQLIDNLVSPITGALGSASAPTFSFTADPNTGIYSPGVDQVAISTGGTGRLFVDASGRVLAGTSSTYTDVIGGAGGYSGPLWLATNESVGTGPFISAWTSSASLDPMGTSVVLSRSKGNAIGTHGILANGDGIGTISFNGSDGSKFVSGAVIRASVDGIPGTNDMPGRLVFSTTADGAASPTERLRIDSSGRVGVGTSSPGEILTINGASNAEARLKIQNQTITIGYLGSHFGIVGSGNANDLILSTGGATNLTFGINTVEKVRIDSSGRLLVGTSTARSNFFGTILSSITQTEGIGGAAGRGALSVINNDVSNNPPYVLLGRSGAATLGSNAVVVSGSRLGTLTFHGADGTSFIEAATVAGEVDGTPGTNDMPGRLVFSTTADGAASPTERLRIDSSGRVGIGTTSPLKELQINATTPTIRLEENGGGSKRLEISIDSSALARIDSTQSSGQLLFGTVGTERARIDSSGRLLVGTSSDRSSAGVNGRFQLEGNSYNTSSVNLINNGNDNQPSYLVFGKSRSGSVGGTTVVQSGDYLGRIDFAGADGSSLNSVGAFIGCQVDGTPGANDMPGRLVFATTADGASSPTERMRINSDGAITFQNAGVSLSSGVGFKYNANATNPNLGLVIDSNDGNTSHIHLYNINATNNAYRFYVKSNGGISNFSANNVNLSDRSVKKDIAPAADTWNCLKEWEVVNYRYKDQPDDADLNLGVIAQQVAESCPEVITVFQEATEDEPEKLGIKEQQMYWMAIKALQEAQVRIEALEAKVAALETL